jgi:hypothetical protein
MDNPIDKRTWEHAVEKATNLLIKWRMLTRKEEMIIGVLTEQYATLNAYDILTEAKTKI